MERKGLSLFALVMIAIGSTIGSGVFKTPTTIAQDVPSVWGMHGLWIAGGLVSMIGALVFAELGRRYTNAGGVYSYLQNTWGTLPAFLYGWCLMTVVSSGTIAALIVVFVDFSQKLIPFADSSKGLIAALSIVVLTLFNTFSLRSSEWFANVATLLKMLGIFGLIILLLVWGQGAAESAVIQEELDAKMNWAGAFVGVLWSYTGWHYASFVSGDARKPQRDVPIAMIVGTLLVTAIYVLCNWGYLNVLSVQEMMTSETLAADAAEKVVPHSGWMVSLLIALSVFGCAGLYVLATPRIIQQMSKEGVFFQMFSKAHPKFGVPLNAIMLQSIWAIVLVFFWDGFEDLFTYVTITEWFFLLLTCLGFIALVVKNREYNTLRNKVYLALSIIFSIVVTWFIFKNATSNNPAAYYGLLVIPIGMGFYYFMKRR
jgi:APA family basic amino acid/polyamine antiporter